MFAVFQTVIKVRVVRNSDRTETGFPILIDEKALSPCPLFFPVGQLPTIYQPNSHPASIKRIHILQAQKNNLTLNQRDFSFISMHNYTDSCVMLFLLDFLLFLSTCRK